MQVERYSPRIEGYGGTRTASLDMYASPAPIAAANDALWRFLRDGFRQQGIDGAPDALNADLAYNEIWFHPGLLFAQTCGYPYMHSLRGHVRLVATPSYALPGCDGPDACSFIIVRADDPVGSLENLRGTTAAINSRDSNSGMNLFRRAVAPFAQDGCFFSAVVETGGHIASVAAVTAGDADVAAIDCVTYGNLQRFAPDRLAGVRVLARTPSGPGLPFITRASASDGEVEAMRQVLRAALVDPAMEQVRQTLALRDIVTLSDADYGRLLVFEEEARSMGYPQLA
ncbi:PhnD/SsuA/transferrin family substrate-binding protein [Rhizobium daejeonense]|uniref:PhnD/SsuA/transferrin family substrate-binding protein n=1 Tax=Rhizobium daejeonense TaxID=240521 RepID=A0A6M1S3N5_9HYPH|nr:PhnD/SsuA/transferrin family substrate-binding protein [Rhizobium daejeonense]NGO65695.1 PhnD/SsuA/transferrin family substrate-binding protein [Rhizobium daejeonense]